MRRPRRWPSSSRAAGAPKHCPPLPARSCTCIRRPGATAPTASSRCSRAALIGRATGRSSCWRWTASCAATSRRPASRCSCARSRSCDARRCRRSAWRAIGAALARDAGGLARLARARGVALDPHEHVGHARRRRRRADRADPPRLAHARDLHRLRALLARLPAPAAQRRPAAVRVAGDPRAARRDRPRARAARRARAGARACRAGRRAGRAGAAAGAPSSSRSSAGSRPGRARTS